MVYNDKSHFDQREARVRDKGIVGVRVTMGLGSKVSTESKSGLGRITRRVGTHLNLY